MHEQSGESEEEEVIDEGRWVGSRETGTGIRLTKRHSELIRETSWSVIFSENAVVAERE